MYSTVHVYREGKKAMISISGILSSGYAPAITARSSCAIISLASEGSAKIFVK